MYHKLSMTIPPCRYVDLKYPESIISCPKYPLDTIQTFLKFFLHLASCNLAAYMLDSFLLSLQFFLFLKKRNHDLTYVWGLENENILV